MLSVSVLGASSQTVLLTYNASDAAFAAQALANTITSDVQAGTLTAVNYTGSAPPTQSNGDLVVSSAPGGTVQQPSGYNVLVDSAPEQIAVLGAAGSFQRVLAADGGLLYYFGAASSGTVLSGDGNNYVTNADPNTGAIPTTGGVYNVLLGNGNNTVALESGQSTIATGTGMNMIALGTSNSQVTAAGGQTTIIGDVSPGAVPGSGSDTITAGGGFVSVYGGFSNFTFVGGTGTVTVQGAGGSDTVFANGSTGLFASGTAGNSVIVGGSTGATAVGTFVDAGGFHVTSGQVLVGIANGDQLVAGQSGAEYLQAGAGTETLDGSQSTGNNTYFAGNNVNFSNGTFYAVTQINTGAGTSTVFGGTGFSTVTAGSGNTTLALVQGVAAGGTMTITNFDPAHEQVRLYNYAAGEAQAAIAGAQVGPAGTTVTLSDNTRIVFQGYTGGFNGNSFA
jgi:hypothetical protein